MLLKLLPLQKIFKYYNFWIFVSYYFILFKNPIFNLKKN